MLPPQKTAWGTSRSSIRELAEYGARRKKEIGEDRVYDFSLGNPSVPAPDCVNEAIVKLIKEESSIGLHGYTTAAGQMSLRTKLAEDLNKRLGTSLRPELMYVSCGAAASLTISLNAVLTPGDEVIVNAPFFPEYRVFVEGAGGVLRVVQPREDLEPDIDGLRAAFTSKTRAVIINSPNNPSGAVYSESYLRALAKALREQEEKTGETIYLISDEPYREIVYGDQEVPCPMNYYDDTIMCYSFSKSLSIPGERIGYIAVNPSMRDLDKVYAAIVGSARALGYVNPPSLFQQVLEMCIGETSDLSQYRRNRDMLCRGLDEIGYTYHKPEGAFYLFMKALEPDARAFSERAKAHELLLVPSDDFGCPGYVRIAYCVSPDTIGASMPAFKALYDEYQQRA